LKPAPFEYVAPHSIEEARARKVESALIGQEPNKDAIRDAAALVEDFLDPPGDIHASRAYRKHVAAMLTARVLKRAVQVCRDRRLR